MNLTKAFSIAILQQGNPFEKIILGTVLSLTSLNAFAGNFMKVDASTSADQKASVDFLYISPNARVLITDLNMSKEYILDGIWDLTYVIGYTIKALLDYKNIMILTSVLGEISNTANTETIKITYSK